jgi:8-oxo-dGTP pyrophosphatase MutT (NUDIX family)
MMDTVECWTHSGKSKLIPKKQLIQRPTVYGFVTHEDKILLLRSRISDHYVLPGGGIGLGEKTYEALIRETKEESGIRIEVGEFLGFDTRFYYFEQKGKAFHYIMFFYHCRPLTFTLIDDDLVDDKSAGKPRWVDINSLDNQSLSSYGPITAQFLGRLSPVKFKKG